MGTRKVSHNMQTSPAKIFFPSKKWYENQKGPTARLHLGRKVSCLILSESVLHHYSMNHVQGRCDNHNQLPWQKTWLSWKAQTVFQRWRKEVHLHMFYKLQLSWQLFFLIIYIHIDIFVASVLVSLNRFNPPVVHARSGERMTMHVANQVLASMRYNHPKPQVNVLVLGTVYTLGH